MSLIKCRECDHEISSEAKTCPNCGCPTQVKRRIKPAFLPLLILGIALTVFGTVLVWDSLLFLFPEPFDVPQPDWKEFWIGLGSLVPGIALSIVGALLSAEKGHFLSGKGKFILPASCVALVLLLGLIFQIEIDGTYWFTRHTMVSANFDGEEQWFDIRMRYFITVLDETEP